MNGSPKRFYEFNSFRIDLAERVLFRNGEPLTLTPKVFDLLSFLVENRGHAVTKDQIMEHLWPDTFTEENNLTRNISMLRKVLGDDAHLARYIKTIPKLGYRFEPDVKKVFEDDETLVVERRTTYTVAVREEIEKRDQQTFSRRASRYRLAFAAGIIVILVSAAVVIAVRRSGTASTIFDTTTDPSAPEMYEKGRRLWQDRSAAGLHEATILLEGAVGADAGFALGHAALADAYAFDSTNWGKAEAAALRAAEIEPKLGQPYATIGFVRLFWEWRPREAEENFKKAILLSPDYAPAHQWYAMQLIAAGQLNQGLAEMTRALELEPDSVAINTDMCEVLFFLQRYDEAALQCRNTLARAPDSFNLHNLLYKIYTANGNYDAAVNEFFICERITVNSSALPSELPGIREAYEREGIRGFWRKLIDVRRESPEDRNYVAARYYALLGERESAVRGLERAFEKRDFAGWMMFADPTFRELMSEPSLNERWRAMYYPDR